VGGGWGGGGGGGGAPPPRGRVRGQVRRRASMPDTGHQAPARARGLTHTRRAQAPWSGRCSAGCCTRGARAGRACCLLLSWRWTLPGRWHTCTRPTAWCAPARGRRPSTRRPAAPAGGARALARRWPPCRARGGPSAGRRSAGASLRMHCSKAPGPHRRGPASLRLAGTACGDRARPPTPGAWEGAGRRRLRTHLRRPRRCTATSRPATCCSRGGAPSARWARAGCGPRRAPRSMQRPAGSAPPCLRGGSAGRGAEPAPRGCPACSHTPAAWPYVCARGRGALACGRAQHRVFLRGGALARLGRLQQRPWGPAQQAGARGLLRAHAPAARPCSQVADFGCAQRAVANRITVEPGRRGALAYQAPEVLERGELTPATDCYAFGVLLWEMLAAQARPDGRGACLGSPHAPLWRGRPAPGARPQRRRCCSAPEGRRFKVGCCARAGRCGTRRPAAAVR